jgi:hypothetical protein
MPSWPAQEERLLYRITKQHYFDTRQTINDQKFINQNHHPSSDGENH